jgi:flagellar biosynthesis protein FlhF
MHLKRYRAEASGKPSPGLAPTSVPARWCCRPGSSDEDYAGVEIFVGPPGAGKTTTVAKIAAQERARRGARLGLVAADGFRVGAVEQLRLYADIIGSPFVVARSPSELGGALEACRGTWLVDTAGRSPGDDQAEALFDVIAGAAGARTHLVLPASLPVRSAERVLSQFDAARPSRVVLTRTDEVDTLAPFVDLCRERDLPISYLGTGQRVPEDLERATAAMLATHLLGDHAAPNGAQA